MRFNVQGRPTGLGQPGLVAPVTQNADTLFPRASGRISCHRKSRTILKPLDADRHPNQPVPVSNMELDAFQGVLQQWLSCAEASEQAGGGGGGGSKSRIIPPQPLLSVTTGRLTVS